VRRCMGCGSAWSSTTSWPTAAPTAGTWGAACSCRAGWPPCTRSCGWRGSDSGSSGRRANASAPSYSRGRSTRSRTASSGPASSSPSCAPAASGGPGCRGGRIQDCGQDRRFIEICDEGTGRVVLCESGVGPVKLPEVLKPGGRVKDLECRNRPALSGAIVHDHRAGLECVYECGRA
jgi:hypothetical protein